MLRREQPLVLELIYSRGKQDVQSPFMTIIREGKRLLRGLAAVLPINMKGESYTMKL